MVARFLANAAALAIATALLPGITLSGGDLTNKVLAIAVVAVIFGVLNTLVKPLLKFISLPLVVVTLGLFLWVVNAIMLRATSAVAGQLGQPWHVDGWGAALLGSLVISVISGLVGGALKGDE